MKNLLVINPWTGKIGPNTFLEGFVTQNIAAGNRITIVYPFKDPISIYLSSLGCKVYFVPFVGFKQVGNLFFKILARVFFEIGLFFLLPLIAWRKSYDHCLVNTEILSFSLIPLSLFVNLSVVVHSLSFYSAGILTRAVFFLHRFAVKNYFAVSNAVKVALLSKGVSKPIFMIYNGLDLCLYNKKVRLGHSEIIEVLSVIHPVPHKGAHYLLDVIRLVTLYCENVRFIVVGWNNGSEDGVYKKEIENRVLSEGLERHVVFKSVSQNMIGDYLKADVLLHPSESESFGYVLIEAMALNIPVVAFNVGGIPEIIENNRSGFLIEPYDIEQMASQILVLINNAELRVEFGIRGQNIVRRKFDREVNLNRMMEILDLKSNKEFANSSR